MKYTVHRAMIAVAAFAALLSVPVPIQAQWGDLGGWDGELAGENGAPKLKLGVEMRTRYEQRDGIRFGARHDKNTAYTRLRAGMSYLPAPWIKFSGMMNDSRAPLFGPDASTSDRNGFDLQESYIELFPDYKEGFGLTVGRRMLKYGDSRLIGTPDWGNVNQSFDQARLQYRFPKAQLELLFVSPVKANEDFDRPVLGDHVIGTYNTFPKLLGQTTVQAYILRRSRNRPGGFSGGNQAAGTDKVDQNIFGARLNGPVAAGINHTVEGVLQTGDVGAASFRAWGGVATLSRQWTVGGKKLDGSGEYKFASGTHNPNDPARNGTFDTIYASNHDKFGHQDLLAWRNMHNFRALAKCGLWKSFAVNLMYNNSWLASTRDALYTNSGGVIAQDKTGAAGRHVGQEWDGFVTYKYKYHTFGAGYGYFFKGEFIRNATSGVNPNYAYVFHTHSF